RQTQGPAHLDHATGKQAQTLVTAVLLRLFEEQLIAEADAQQWPALTRKLHDPAAQVPLLQLPQGRREGPHAGQHQAVGAGQLVEVGGHARGGSPLQYSTLDRAQVADAIVDDRDHPESPDSPRLFGLVIRATLWTRARHPLSAQPPGAAPAPAP